MTKKFNAADYHLGANPALKKSNSSFPFWAVFISVALLISGAWFFFPPKIRITNIRLELAGNHVSAAGEAVNDTNVPVTVTLRFSIGGKIGSKGNARFLTVGEHIASYDLAPHSTTPVRSEFTQPAQIAPTYADIQILKY